MSNLFKVSAEDIKSALVTVGIATVVAAGIYILQVGDVFSIDWKALVNAVVIAGVTSILKALGTTEKGKFAGVKIK